MTTFRYRAATTRGVLKTGTLDGASVRDALERVRQLGLVPIEAVETAQRTARVNPVRSNSGTRRAVANTLGELAVLLTAGLTLDRALLLCSENVSSVPVRDAFGQLRERVKQGVSLARAMAEMGDLFSPMSCAMTEAGEASGQLGQALAKLAESLDRAEALRETIVSALIYPALLTIVAIGVILVMLLVVVPQFESLFEDMGGKLPFMTQMVMGASDAVRTYGPIAALALAISAFAGYRMIQQPQVRLAFDRNMLRVPSLGPLIRNSETARFARTLGSLVESGVALPTAIAISQRTIGNSYMAQAIAGVADGLKHGGGLSGPLARTGVFPKSAMSFLRTGEETAQLGLMLNRLADVLDRDVRTAVQRSIAILTPAMTVIMGVVVATVIASIMSAMLGFNDLALGS